jgi:hypothetical protein
MKKKYRTSNCSDISKMPLTNDKKDKKYYQSPMLECLTQLFSVVNEVPLPMNKNKSKIPIKIILCGDERLIHSFVSSML